jgi:hypothetical protein
LFPLTCTDAAVCLHSSGEKTANKLTCCNACRAKRQTKDTAYYATTQGQAYLRGYFTNSFSCSRERARQNIVKSLNFAGVATYNVSTVLLNRTAHAFSAKVTQRRTSASDKLPCSSTNIGHKSGGIWTFSLNRLRRSVVAVWENACTKDWRRSILIRTKTTFFAVSCCRQ